MIRCHDCMTGHLVIVWTSTERETTVSLVCNTCDKPIPNSDISWQRNQPIQQATKKQQGA